VRIAAFIVPADHPGGAEQVATTLANALSRRPDWAVEFHILSKAASPSFTGSRLAAEVQVLHGRTAWPLAGVLLLPWRFWRRRFDLVFTTHLHVNAVASLSRRLGLLRTRRLVTRESTTVFDRFHGAKRAVAKALYATYGPQDLAISQTGYMRSHIASRIGRRARNTLVVLGNPLDLAAIDRMAKERMPEAVADRLEGRVNLLVCGRMIGIKQPLLALEAFARLASVRPEPLQLVFLGDGPLRSSVETAALRHRLSDRVVFLGRHVNPYPIMRACQYGLLTSSREGFPNVVLEMMACGIRKIVMTPCAGDLDTLHGVTVTTGFGAEELADALGGAMSEGEDRSGDYRAVAAQRSVETYLDAVLEMTPPGHPDQTPRSLGLHPTAIRLLDACAALLGGVMALPVIAIAAAVVKLDSPGPAIFAQQRVGRGEKVFTCYKLRTMAAGTGSAATHDTPASSVTRPGGWLRRTKIDELPQLLNVLFGEMSLVGPRPCLPSQTALIEARRERGVYAVRPGITGRAQVLGLNMSTPAELAEEDAIWAAGPRVADYVRLVLATMVGKGRGDGLRS
jgi:lipopolysaccharide/colanic/teichoic acid biosynthesis glycosyltransferase/glycosyltransferase involved in cell wall biosynthesis